MGVTGNFRVPAVSMYRVRYFRHVIPSSFYEKFGASDACCQEQKESLHVYGLKRKTLD